MTDEQLPSHAPVDRRAEVSSGHPPHDFLPPIDDPELLRVLAVGSRTVVNIFVHRLHQANIVHFSEWSRLLPTPNPGEWMRILTKRIPIERNQSEQNRTE